MGLPEHSSSKAAAVSLMTASEAILCYFYNILLVTQAQGCESQEVGFPGVALEAACHQVLALLCLSGPPVPLFFFLIFLMWAILRVFMEFLQYCFCFMF